MDREVPAPAPPTVLLIEDDDVVRDGLVELLVQAGYQIATASTGHDAMGLLRAPLSPIGVVILDVRLPDIDGVGLGTRLRQLYPEIPIVVCSGAANSKEIAALRKLGVHHFLRKPIRNEQLLAILRAVLAGAKP